LPNAGVITGIDSVCAGSVITLADAVTGGTWSTGSSAIASVSATGVVRGIAGGSAVISYTTTNSCGPRSATFTVNVLTGGSCPSEVGTLQPVVSSMQVYPNPTDGMFTIELPATNASATITIIDVLGKTVLVREVDNAQGSRASINLLDVAAGSYIIKVTSGSQSFRDKIVIW
jgi:hypothetical protein